MKQTSVLDIKGYNEDSSMANPELVTVAAEEDVEYLSKPQLEKAIVQAKKKWKKQPRTSTLWK